MDETTGAVTFGLAALLAVVLCTTQAVRCNRDDNTLTRSRIDQLAAVKIACVRSGGDALACDKLTLP